MANAATTRLAIRDVSQVADARRQVAALIQAVGFDEEVLGRIAIIVTELTTNLLVHGHGGDLLCRALPGDEGLELIACDRGPGMADVQECLRDGFSTAGTAGNGLGAIVRLSSTFDLFSAPGQGTVVLAQVLVRREAPRRRFLIGAVCLPLIGESACGDDWLAQASGSRLRVIVVDGLGHGPEAAVAAQLAIASGSEAPDQPPALVLDRVHRAIAATRGAAVAVCDIDIERGSVTFCGVGNIAGVLLGVQQRSLVSHNGIVGHQQRRTQEFSYPWIAGGMAILHSDGVQTRWSLDDYPGLRARHPAVIAAVLQRDFSRGRDDVCVVVAKEER